MIPDAQRKIYREGFPQRRKGTPGISSKKRGGRWEKVCLAGRLCDKRTDQISLKSFCRRAKKIRSGKNLYIWNGMKTATKKGRNRVGL